MTSRAGWLGRALRGAAIALACLLVLAPAVRAETPAPADAPPNQVRLLLDLLADPAVRDWLEKRRAEEPAKVEASPERTAARTIAALIDSARTQIGNLVEAYPKFGDEAERAWIILNLEFEERGLVRILLLLIGFVALGVGVEQIFHRSTKRFVAWFLALPQDSVRHRLRAQGYRLAYAVGMVAAFALGSLGAFLPFEWPPLLREIVFEYLLSFLILRIILVFGRFVLAPGGPKYRILPMEIPAAWFWYRRLAAFFGWTVFVRASMRLIETLGVNEDVRRLVGIACMLVILAILTEVAWRRPRPAPDSPAEAARPPSAWLATGYFAVLWLMFIAGTGPRPIFWLAVIAVTLPAAIRLTRRAVNNLFRPANVATAEDEAPSVAAVCLDRGLQAVLIIGSTVFLAHQWDIDLIELTARDTVATRLLRGTLSAVVIILVADFAWHLMKVLIDRKLMGVDAEGRLDEDEVRRRARMRTLLPIIRNVVFVILIVMVVLMVLASLGIDIGPLIAGAGVVGVAIGFGAQTLVKDVISGIFYLIDDAFRVGEYVQSAQHKGTVESFSLRSVKLRHHRGPLTTVPFGELGAIQNMSRDWVIDKLQIGVTYDTDIDKAKKLIKEIGKALAADPEFAPHILETLKMQGVENFGDFAINLRLKMKTKPGEQFVIRRRTYALIKKAFDANGIKFAYQTVQIAGNGDAQPAVAQAAIDMTRPPAVT